MIYRVRHVTRYDYSVPVDLGAHMLHLRPRPLPWQRVLSERLLMTPAPTRRSDGVDHFGNSITWLFMEEPHRVFEVTSESVVEVRFPDPPAASSTPPWESVAAAARLGRSGNGGAARRPGAADRGAGAWAADRTASAWAAAEYRFDSPMVPTLPEAGEYARPSFPTGRPVLEALLDLNARIRREFSFRAGVTTLATPVSEVLARREGVCQDFTHLMLSALRALGLPARYTSGYIRTRPPPGMPRRRGADQSHAWVGAWMGPDHGWVDLDPTNDVVVRDEHVVLAWGRDYADISPVRGVVLGGGAHRLDVGVDLEPADED